jgi:hypothetical protein
MMEGCDEEYIGFTLEDRDREGVTFTYENTLVITIITYNHKLLRFVILSGTHYFRFNLLLN